MKPRTTCRALVWASATPYRCGRTLDAAGDCPRHGFQTWSRASTPPAEVLAKVATAGGRQELAAAERARHTLTTDGDPDVDRAIGRCACGQWLDAGTADEVARSHAVHADGMARARLTLAWAQQAAASAEAQAAAAALIWSCSCKGWFYGSPDRWSSAVGQHREHVAEVTANGGDASAHVLHNGPYVGNDAASPPDQAEGPPTQRRPLVDTEVAAKLTYLEQFVPDGQRSTTGAEVDRVVVDEIDDHVEDPPGGDIVDAHRAAVEALAARRAEVEAKYRRLLDIPPLVLAAAPAVVHLGAGAGADERLGTACGADAAGAHLSWVATGVTCRGCINAMAEERTGVRPPETWADRVAIHGYDEILAAAACKPDPDSITFHVEVGPTGHLHLVDPPTTTGATTVTDPTPEGHLPPEYAAAARDAGATTADVEAAGAALATHLAAANLDPDTVAEALGDAKAKAMAPDPTPDQEHRWNIGDGVTQVAAHVTVPAELLTDAEEYRNRLNGLRPDGTAYPFDPRNPAEAPAGSLDPEDWTYLGPIRPGMRFWTNPADGVRLFEVLDLVATDDGTDPEVQIRWLPSGPGDEPADDAVESSWLHRWCELAPDEDDADDEDDGPPSLLDVVEAIDTLRDHAAAEGLGPIIPHLVTDTVVDAGAWIPIPVALAERIGLEPAAAPADRPTIVLGHLGRGLVAVLRGLLADAAPAPTLDPLRAAQWTDAVARVADTLDQLYPDLATDVEVDVPDEGFAVVDRVDEPAAPAPEVVHLDPSPRHLGPVCGAPAEGAMVAMTTAAAVSCPACLSLVAEATEGGFECPDIGDLVALASYWTLLVAIGDSPDVAAELAAEEEGDTDA